MIGPILFSIGSLKFYTHGSFIVLAVIASSISIYYLSQRVNLNKTVIFDLVIYTLLFGIIGARITYFILYRDQFNTFGDLFKVWQGGLVSWGGFVLGIAAATVVLKLYKENILKWLDILLISGLAGLAIGRLGSFLSGELAGLHHSGFLSVSGVYPVTLYEFIFTAALFIFWLFIYLRYNGLLNPGILSLEIVTIYSLGRFLLDFLRTDSKIFLGLGLSQLFSAIVFVISVITLAVIVFAKSKGPQNDISTNN